MKNIFKFPAQNMWETLLERPALEKKDLRNTVQEIFLKVNQNGDAALKEFAIKFDQVSIDKLLVSTEEIEFAVAQVSPELKAAIDQAKKNIFKFHAAQKEQSNEIETTPGVICWRESRAIEKVGLYIPGGTAPLFSTVLMLAIPAQIAGCKEVILCTPPQKEGSINPAILYTAQLCGITQIFKVGGAQAIAALTIGTESIPTVDKIFGPGNQYVTQAKQLAMEYNVAIDLPAGPSEVLVIADSTANPEFCAADLLSQAEHGTDSQVIFIATNENVFNDTLKEIEKQLLELPRNEIVKLALENSRFILMRSVDEALEMSNFYAPEHLILAVENPRNYIGKITNTGSVFLGNYTPESAGDYASGTNHTLPTNGFAKNYSGVSLDSFVKKITIQEISKTGLQNIGKTIELMAAAEGLNAHKNAVSVRLKSLETEFNLEQTIRPHLVGMKSYSASRTTDDKDQFILLDANENPFGNYNRYPDAENVQLKRKLAEINKIDASNLFLGNGSDELIDLLMRIFCDPEKDSIMVFNPSFVMYEIYAKMNNVAVEKLQLNSDFQLNKTEFNDALSKTQAKILFLCSPNNPTGNSIDDLEYFIKCFNGIVVVDEAYIEFSPEESAASLLTKYPNLIVLKTLSKSYGMAGLRIGVGISSPEIAALLNRFKPPYNISSESQRLALQQLQNEEEQTENIQIILAEKEILKKGLAENKEVVKIYPSDANFFLVEFKDAEKIYQKLLQANIWTSLRHPALKNCLRLSVGKPAENLKVLNVLSEIKS